MEKEQESGSETCATVVARLGRAMIPRYRRRCPFEDVVDRAQDDEVTIRCLLRAR